MRRRVSIGIAVAFAALLAPVAGADTAPIANTPDLPWSNPAHTTNLEVLAGQIASVIAGRTVTVRCEGDTDWTTLVTQSGGNPVAELGYVSASFSANGQVRSIATFTELAGGKVCLPLKNFAAATAKPTKCTPPSTPVVTTKRVQTKVYVVVSGKRRLKTVWTTKKVTTPGVPGPPVPCFAGNGKSAAQMPDSYWEAYETYAQAILTLAHESIHLGGVVGLTLTTGTVVGDPLAEAKANCYGMQWMPYVAEQLGDTADDAQAIAEYYWKYLYPQYETSSFTQYWSADCKPGGSLDIRPTGSTAWP